MPTWLKNHAFPKKGATRPVSNLRISSPPEFLNPSQIHPVILFELLSKRLRLLFSAKPPDTGPETEARVERPHAGDPCEVVWLAARRLSVCARQPAKRERASQLWFHPLPAS